MYKYVLSFMVMFSSAAVIAEEISSSELVDMLVNDKIASCTSELKAKTASYDVWANGTSAGAIEGAGQSKTKTSTISYMLVQGGDMIMGNASITITYKFRGQFGFEQESAYSIPYIDSCKVEVKTH